MNASFLILSAFTLFACGQTATQRQATSYDTRSLKDTCDNPDAPISCSFLNLPLTLSSTLSMADKDEPGEKLVISGTVYKEDGQSAYPNLIIYAYQTDSKGYYTKKGTETGAQKWHGQLHGWCKTDSNGYYKIETIKPARYPDNSMPAHIHAAIKKENGQMYWISDFVFGDDSLVDDKYLSTIKDLVGGTGVVHLRKEENNTWTGKRDIVVTK